MDHHSRHGQAASDDHDCGVEDGSAGEAAADGAAEGGELIGLVPPKERES